MLIKIDQDPKLDIFGISGEMPQSGMTMSENRFENDITSPMKEQSISLDKGLIDACYTTFFARVNGNSMKDAAVENSDLLVIDKSLRPYHNCLAVCFLDGGFVLKRVKIQEDRAHAVSCDDEPAFSGNAADGHCLIWGVVKYVIKRKQEGDTHYFV